MLRVQLQAGVAPIHVNRASLQRCRSRPERSNTAELEAHHSVPIAPDALLAPLEWLKISAGWPLRPATAEKLRDHTRELAQQTLGVTTKRPAELQERRGSLGRRDTSPRRHSCSLCSRAARAVEEERLRPGATTMR